MTKPNFPKLKVSIPFFILMAVLYVMDFRNVLFPTLVAIFAHELSHIAAIHFCGGTVGLIDIRAFGIRVNVPELQFMSYKREIIIAAAGPLAGIIIASCAVATAKVLNIENLNYFIGVNLVITVINLIPVYPLDGGRIALSALLMLFPIRVAYTVSYILAILSVSVLFALCAATAAVGELNPSLVIFSIYIALCGAKFRPLI